MRWLIVAAMSTYLVGLLTFGRFPNTDETVYKAAGREWAMSGQFAAPEIEGLNSLEPPVERVFAIYPPVYPFLFGLFIRGLGFGWRQCVAYDGLIHCALILAALRLAGRLSASSLPPAWQVAGAVALLPLGTAGRPDELGAVFGLLGLSALLPQINRRGVPAVAGIPFGLAIATSPPAALLLGLLAIPQLRAAVPPPSLGRPAVLMTFTAALPLASVWLYHHGAYQQFLSQPEVGGKHLDLLAGMSWSVWRHGLPTVACISFLVLLGAAELGRRAPYMPVPLTRSWLASLASLLLVVALFPGKHTYLRLVGLVLIVLALCSIAEHVRHRQGARATLSAGLLLLALVAGSVPTIQHSLILMTLPSDQTLDAASAQVRARIPRGAVVLVDDLWWVMASDYRVLDALWSRPRHPDEIGWVVLSGNGTGEPGRPRKLRSPLAEFVARCFEPVYDGLNRASTSVGGVPVSHSGYGFSPLLLRRVSCDTES